MDVDNCSVVQYVGDNVDLNIISPYGYTAFHATDVPRMQYLEGSATLVTSNVERSPTGAASSRKMAALVALSSTTKALMTHLLSTQQQVELTVHRAKKTLREQAMITDFNPKKQRLAFTLTVSSRTLRPS